jgi:tetratricopeptide (TPR) repeat protein
LQKYRQIAVLPFADAPGAPQSGQIVQGLASQIFSKSGFKVIERGRLDDIVNEQKLSSSGLMDATHAIQVGKLLGVTAVVIGEVGQYAVSQRHTDTTYFPLPIAGQITRIPIQGKQWNESHVSMSLRVIDVETAQLIYSGSGQYDRGLTNPPQQLAAYILRDIIAGWVRDPSQSQRNKEVKNSTMLSSSSVPSPAAAKKGFNEEAVAWTEKSEDSIKSKNWGEVIRTTSVAIRIDPSYPAAYVNRCWAYLEKGFVREAFADCQRALELDGTNTAAHNNRGLFYLRTGQVGKAKDDFETACNGGLEVSCNNFKMITGYKLTEKTGYYLKKANEAFADKNWDEVIQHTSEIVSSKDQRDIILAVRGGAYAYKGLLKEAIEDCDEAIKLNPNSALSYNNKAYALELMGKTNEALLNYEFACNLNMPLGCTNIKRLLKK